MEGSDLLNGTPRYDIKPYLPYTDSHPDARGGYADEFRDYRLKVTASPDILSRIPEDKRQSVLDCIAEDPRPSYSDDAEKVYGMRFADLDIRFLIADGTAKLISVEKCE